MSTDKQQHLQTTVRWPMSRYLREAVGSGENPLLVDNCTTAKMISVIRLNAHLIDSVKEKAKEWNNNCQTKLMTTRFKVILSYEMFDGMTNPTSTASSIQWPKMALPYGIIVIVTNLQLKSAIDSFKVALRCEWGWQTCHGSDTPVWKVWWDDSPAIEWASERFIPSYNL